MRADRPLQWLASHLPLAQRHAEHDQANLVPDRGRGRSLLGASFVRRAVRGIQNNLRNEDAVPQGLRECVLPASV